VDRDRDRPVTGADQVPGGREQVPGVTDAAAEHWQPGGHPHRATGHGRIGDVDVAGGRLNRRRGGSRIATTERRLRPGQLGPEPGGSGLQVLSGFEEAERKPGTGSHQQAHHPQHNPQDERPAQVVRSPLSPPCRLGAERWSTRVR
jgi:hypothetical protein